MNPSQADQHHVIPRGDQSVTVYGVFANDRTVTHDRTIIDGVVGDSTGQECTLVVTLAVARHLLDVGVARVGFMGSHNGDIFSLDVPGGAEYRTGLWDLVFPMRRYFGDVEEQHAYAGAFYVETRDHTYHWLKYLGESDFRFDYSSLPTLGSLAPAS